MQCTANCWFCIVHTGPEKMNYYAVTAVYYFTQSRGREWQNIFFIPEKAAISYVMVHHGHIWSKLIKQWDSLTSETINQVQALIESKVEKESVGDVSIHHKHKPLTSEHVACSSTVSSLYVRLCSPVQTEDTSKTALRCDSRTSAHQKLWQWNRLFHLNSTASHMSSTGADMMKSKNIKTRGRGAQKIFTLLWWPLWGDSRWRNWTDFESHGQCVSLCGLPDVKYKKRGENYTVGLLILWLIRKVLSDMLFELFESQTETNRFNKNWLCGLLEIVLKVHLVRVNTTKEKKDFFGIREGLDEAFQFN